VDGEGGIYYTNVPGKGRAKISLPIKKKTSKPWSTPSLEKEPYESIITSASQRFAVDEDLVRAVIKAESNFDYRAVSPKGALGLMQLMPTTGRRMGVRDPFNPRQNILGGTRYLRYLANIFGGDLVLTIAGYHAGENAVIRYRGVPPYETTQRYVPAVLRHYYQYRSQQPGSLASSASTPSPSSY